MNFSHCLLSVWKIWTVKEGCPQKITKLDQGKEILPSESVSGSQTMVVNDGDNANEAFGPWMLVERRNRRKNRDSTQSKSSNLAEFKEGSRFSVLSTMEQSSEKIPSKMEKKQEFKRR